MRFCSKFLTVFLISLFLAFSFNAYACIVPVFSKTPATQERDCTKPGKEPVTQFCDGFKSLAVQNGADASFTQLSNLTLIGNLPAFHVSPITTSQLLFTSRSGDLSPPGDLLLLISVFRI